MADYVDRNEVLKWKETITTDDYSGNEIIDVVGVEDILDIESADVIERSKIDKVISILEREQNSEWWIKSFRDGIGYALGILKRNIGE